MLKRFTQGSIPDLISPKGKRLLVSDRQTSKRAPLFFSAQSHTSSISFQLPQMLRPHSPPKNLYLQRVRSSEVWTGSWMWATRPTRPTKRATRSTEGLRRTWEKLSLTLGLESWSYVDPVGLLDAPKKRTNILKNHQWERAGKGWKGPTW